MGKAGPPRSSAATSPWPAIRPGGARRSPSTRSRSLNAERTYPALVLVLLVATGLTAACAKRPAMTQAAAPPPTAAATMTPTPAPQALAPAAPAPAPAPAAVAPPAPAPAAAQPAPPPAQFAENAALADIHFDFDKSTI